MGITLTGRGLWYGAVNAQGQNLVFDEASWEVCCKQAKVWGITVVHPKVADGVYPRYTDDGMKMLSRVANAHGLQCVPYTYNYGNKLGGLDGEARLCARLGALFGSICIDVEDEWETYQSVAWATRFGQIMRQSFSGPLYVTTFGQPGKHPSIPWVTLNSWMTGLLPQVYWSEWQEGDVNVIIPRVYQQWLELDRHCRSIQKKPLAPISPIIELGQSLPQSEVATWLSKMGGYGYCGFWYSETYAPYAATILKAPLPARRPAGLSKFASTSLVPLETPSLEMPEPLDFMGASSASPSDPQALLSPSSSQAESVEVGSYATVMDIPVYPDPSSVTMMIEPVTPLPLVPATPSHEDGSSEPKLTSLHYRLLWQSRKPDIFFDEGSPVVKRWCEGIAKEESIGVPVAEESEITIDGEKIRYVPLTSNKTIIYFYSLRLTLVV